MLDWQVVDWQTPVALLCVGLSVIYLMRRLWRRRPGCGSCSGCSPSTQLIELSPGKAAGGELDRQAP